MLTRLYFCPAARRELCPIAFLQTMHWLFVWDCFLTNDLFSRWYNKETPLFYSLSPFRLISSLSFNLALFFLITRRQFLLTPCTICPCFQGMSHLARFHYTHTVICQRRKCETCMKHNKWTNEKISDFFYFSSTFDSLTLNCQIIRYATHNNAFVVSIFQKTKTLQEFGDRIMWGCW